MTPDDIVRWTTGGPDLIRIGIKMSYAQWDEFAVSDMLNADPGWISQQSLDNYLAVERVAPLYMALQETVVDPFAGEEFIDEY